MFLSFISSHEISHFCSASSLLHPHGIVREQLCRYLAVARSTHHRRGSCFGLWLWSWARKIQDSKLSTANSNIKVRQQSEKQSSSLSEIVHHEKAIHK